MFWTVTGFDQWVHYMTYVCLIWFWVDYVLMQALVSDLLSGRSLQHLLESLEQVYPTK